MWLHPYLESRPFIDRSVVCAAVLVSYPSKKILFSTEYVDHLHIDLYNDSNGIILMLD